MTTMDYIHKLTERALAAGYTLELERLSPAAAREYKALDFICYGKRMGDQLHVFGVRSGDGLQLEQFRTLSDQFHNAARLSLKEDNGIQDVQTVGVLAFERPPDASVTDYFLSRSYGSWFSKTRHTPCVVELETGRLRRHWFPAKAVKFSLLKP